MGVLEKHCTFYYMISINQYNRCCVIAVIRYQVEIIIYKFFLKFKINSGTNQSISIQLLTTNRIDTREEILHEFKMNFKLFAIFAVVLFAAFYISDAAIPAERGPGKYEKASLFDQFLIGNF